MAGNSDDLEAAINSYKTLLTGFKSSQPFTSVAYNEIGDQYINALGIVDILEKSSKLNMEQAGELRTSIIKSFVARLYNSRFNPIWFTPEQHKDLCRQVYDDYISEQRMLRYRKGHKTASH